MRVATFNTLGFATEAAGDTHERKRAIVEALAENHVDLAMLQEVQTVFGETGPVAHCAELAFRRHPVYGKNFRAVYGDQRDLSVDGVAIASCVPIVDEDYGSLPSGILGRSYLAVRSDPGRPHHVSDVPPCASGHRAHGDAIRRHGGTAA